MNTRNQIIQKALPLFMRLGIRSVTMDDIAREMGISKKTLYEHFPTKNDLLVAAMELHQAEEEKMEATFVTQSKTALQELYFRLHYIIKILSNVSYATLYDMHKYHRAVFDDFNCKHEDKMLAGMRRNIEWGQQEGYYHMDLDTEVVIRNMHYQIKNIMDPDLYDNGAFTKERVFAVVFTQFIRSICTSSGITQWESLQKQLPDFGSPQPIKPL